MRQIIVDKSIQQKCLVYKLNAKLLSNYAMSFIFGIIFPLALFTWSILSPYSFRNSPTTILVPCALVWALLHYYFSIKLVEVPIKNALQKRALIEKIASQEYPKVRFTVGNPTLLRGQKNEGWSGRGKVVSILIGENHVYVNILSTFRGGNFDVLCCGIINYLRAKSLAREMHAVIV